MSLIDRPTAVSTSPARRLFDLHRGGKIEVTPTVALRDAADLAAAYAPSVATVCHAIADDPAQARLYTTTGNSVAVVTDGSAVLGLGAIGPTAALPVMEGKAALFKWLAGVDAWPICLGTDDVDEIVRCVELLAPGFGGINLESISAPRCFEIEDRLRKRLDIPVFHDGQHGTAVVVLAALINALRVVDKELANIRVVVSGIGAAGYAVIRLLRSCGVRDLIACDRNGTVTPTRRTDEWHRRWIADHTNPGHVHGDLRDALEGADVFIGVSAGRLLKPADLSVMAPEAVVFALSDPEPEVDPVGARDYARVVATGRSDQPNQINNVLAFPGIFCGLFDSGLTDVTTEILTSAAIAIAECVTPDRLTADTILPSVCDEAVVPAIADALHRHRPTHQ